MSEVCKSANEEFQLDNKTQPHESIIKESEYEMNFPSNFLEASTVQCEKFQSGIVESFDVTNEDNIVASKENIVNLTLNSTSIDHNLQITEEIGGNETLNDNVSRFNSNIISTELHESNYTQSKNVSSELNEISRYDNHSSRLSTPRVNDYKFSSRSSAGSRVSTPSWAVRSNSNFQTSSENQALKQAKIIKLHGINNEINHRVTIASDLNNESVLEEQIQIAQSDEDPDKNVEKVEIFIKLREFLLREQILIKLYNRLLWR